MAFIRHLGLFKSAARKCLQEGCSAYVQKRNLNVHEYISYQLLSEAGLPVPKFGVAKSKEDVKRIIKDLGIKDVVLKAQVLTGGRGKGTFKSGLKGGVKLISSPSEAENIAGKMLGHVLVTKQTGEKGIKCEKVMVTEKKVPVKEYYLCMLLERAYGGPVLMASAEGGVEIEETARKKPEAIHYFPIDIIKGVTEETTRKAAAALGLSNKSAVMSQFIKNMYHLMITKDALMVEVNPLIQDKKGNFFCLDAKLRFDDSSAFRQKKLFALRDTSQEDPKEVLGKKYDLNYISLDGNIGCMVNGAGLAMATCDIIKLYGGNPANFLDVGGASNEETVHQAFKIILMDEKVKGVFVNIFGGIIRCDIIAKGITKAVREIELKVPAVIRLQGTNVEQGREIITKSKLNLVPVEDFDKAAQTIVKITSS